MPNNPSSTYRVQFHGGFTFDQGAKLANYLSLLGISHLYASPYLQSVKGSTHGYDIVDPTQVNIFLGGIKDFQKMQKALKDKGLGQIIDYVPNHMAIVDRQNPWWWEVLKDGPASKYAKYFDINWDFSEERWPKKVLLPVLEDQYGCVLEKGMLQLIHTKGAFNLHYKDHIFPIDASSLVELLKNAALACDSEVLFFLAESHGRLPKPTVTLSENIERRHRDKAVLLDLLAKLCEEKLSVCKAIDAEVDRLNANADALDALLEKQNYRLAFWRIASKDLGYRRFFDVKELIGVRVEEEEVFNATHALIIKWASEGVIQGIRIDHPDGLRDPSEYFHRLRVKCPDTWLVAEKILTTTESLPQEWPINGTTGYEFLNLAQRLFIDPKSEEILNKIYVDFTSDSIDYSKVVYDCKKLVLTELLASELDQLADLFVKVCERHRCFRDHAFQELKEALLEVAIQFPVYRTYISYKYLLHRSDDEYYIALAIQKALITNPELEKNLLEFLQHILLLRIPGKLEEDLAMRFQQLTSPTMAKGVEDTAFYRYNRFICLNEVGGEPHYFASNIAEFHETCVKNQLQNPFSLLASTTHDTKRSEDVRSRLAVLSEIPLRWSEAINRWSLINALYRGNLLIDRSMEYFLYQTLVGTWPISTERITAYMQKSLREAKLYTSWINPNENYEKAWQEFIRAIIQDENFKKDITNFVDELIYFGQINSLSQTLLKLISPGIPDIYQGTELWTLTLVDPDNRHSVDFAKRENLLNELPHLTTEQILARMGEGLPKLWLIYVALHLRKRKPECFGNEGTYTSLPVLGEKSEHVIAFQRGDGVIGVAPRFLIKLEGDWADTFLEIQSGLWLNVLTGEKFQGGRITIELLLKHFPIALLSKEAT
ncbi:MAG: malto-oligosyltrehalose synthase [Parachlamydiaceae bacterium]|nr:malto-oligosyltrehalose synthase [Parachlamydiaceae bacterium]